MKFFIISVLSLCITTAQCQVQTDSLQQPVIATHQSDRSISTGPRLTAKSLIFPAACITYGFVALRNPDLIHLNHSTEAELQEDHPHFLTHIDNYLQFAPGVAVFALDAVGVKGKNNLRDEAMIYGLTMILSTAIVMPLKNITKVERPDKSSANSFPSGHTTIAFASAEFLREEYKDVSPWYGVAGYAAAAATGALRMYNNRHWFSDVVAGAGFGVLSTKLVYAVYPAIKRKLFKDKAVTWMICPYYDHGAGLACVHHFN